LEILEKAFKETEITNQERYESAKYIFDQFIESAKICIQKLIVLDTELFSSKKQRKDIVHILSDKRNSFNLESKIKRNKS
jgi:hypothetical protein